MANAKPGIQKTEWMTAIILYDRKWKGRDSRKDRLPMGEAYPAVAAIKPPPGADSTLWAAFVWITWVFALRQSEAKGVQPKDLHYDPVNKRWTCTVRFPKVNTYKKIQDITVHRRWVPKSAHLALKRFQSRSWKQGAEVDWENLYKRGQPTKHLQHTFAPLLKEWTIVWHCFRHGRVTELRRVHGWSEDFLQQFGRWRNRNSMLIYLH